MSSSKQSSRKMDGFVAIVTLLIAGAVGVRERVEVNTGEKVPLLDEKSGPLKRVTVNEANQTIFIYCSPEENKFGCSDKSSPKFSFDNETVSLTPLNGSDGIYSVMFFADSVVKIMLIVGANDLTNTSPSAGPTASPSQETNDNSLRQDRINTSSSPGPPDSSPISNQRVYTFSAVVFAVFFTMIFGVIITKWCVQKYKKVKSRKTTDHANQDLEMAERGENESIQDNGGMLQNEVLGESGETFENGELGEKHVFIENGHWHQDLMEERKDRGI